jgi:hypothetical protein
MRTLMLVLGLMTAAAHATEPGRFQAIALEGESGVRSGAARVMIVDTVEGHVWTWSGNELLPDASGSRRYGAAFVYQGKLRPGSKPGEVIDSQPR